MENSIVKNMEPKCYRSGDTPPFLVLFLSSIQQMLLLLPLGIAVPVAITHSIGLDLTLSSKVLAATFFGIGLTSILQTINGKFIGTGLQSFSVSDSAAISACLLAAEIGGMPLVFGMCIFSSIVRFILGSFASHIRKSFPNEAVGAMIFILGINLVPTAFKYILGSNHDPLLYNHAAHILISFSTFAVILICTLFIKPLKPYSALVGIIFGFVICILTGFFDITSFNEVKNQPIFTIPIYFGFGLSFDIKVALPFIIVGIAAVIDNIGDFAAIQRADNKKLEKLNWHSLENGIRAGALGTAISSLIGGCTQSTASSNIGIANATRITSRKIVYVACAMLMIISFFPPLTSILCLIPEPVLGAIVLFSSCYIFSGGLSMLTSLALDDRQVFIIFISINAAISTLIPNLYDFVPKMIKDAIISPMVFGAIVLIITTTITRIGMTKKYTFTSGVNTTEIISLSKKIEEICRGWCIEHSLMQKLIIGFNGLCEGIYDVDKDANLKIEIKYDELKIKSHIEINTVALKNYDTATPLESSSLGIGFTMLKNIFDNIKTSYKNDIAIIDISSDLA